ncbi:hypothetical protein Bca52824_075354 [Brassica carinata]|uniref:TRAFD1/XAF1 zinc finger domain-containing protein n=1 Tax=Brassica carinata TaxID=52824 RepID=A0A8X7PRQ9_BRACI|nr:hypothetical protein Bca52824_075354 [Brassica carinata]
MVEASNAAADVRDRMKGISEHESTYGSRTGPCDSCGRSVMLKDMDIHQIEVLHQARDCPLRFIACRFCGDMVEASNAAADVRDRMKGISEHESTYGSRTGPCDSCGRSVMLKDMDIHQIEVLHQARDCPLRFIACRFCGDMVEASNAAADVRDRMKGISEHESTYGSRTGPCDSCGRSVMLKDMDIHQIEVHGKSS